MRFDTIIPCSEQPAPLRALLSEMNEIRQNPSDSYQLLFTSRLYEFLYHLCRSYSHQIPSASLTGSQRDLQRVTHVMNWVKVHYPEPLSLETAADSLALSKEYFCRLFKKYTGQTFLEYLNDVRTMHLYEDLQNSDETITVLMLYGIDCMVPLNLIEQPGEKKFVKYNGAYRQDLIGYGKQNAWSVWEPVGRSENSQAAFGNGCRAASEIEKINENPLAKSAACMTYYERGYLNAVVKEPERTGDGTLWFPEENYFKAYYQPLFELFADEQPGELYGSSGGFELELTLPWTEEGKRGFRHLQIGTDQVTIALMREGKYDQILKRMENVLDLSKERRFCGEDGIWVGAE